MQLAYELHKKLSGSLVELLVEGMLVVVVVWVRLRVVYEGVVAVRVVYVVMVTMEGVDLGAMRDSGEV